MVEASQTVHPQAQLNRQLAQEQGLTGQQAAERPLKMIQFGEGNFLRGFVDWLVQELNNHSLFNGNVAIVQPLPQGRVDALEAQDRLYSVILEGLADGQKVRSRQLIDSIGKTANPYEDWEDYLSLADDPQTQIIVSNTTEAGISLNDADTVQTCPPASYPAKLAHLLHRRYIQGLPGMLIMPCELIADNGPALRTALLECAKRFGWEQGFSDWLERENMFVSTLVDRITPGYPRDQAQALWEEMGYEDQNMVKAEPFFLWVVAGDQAARAKVDELLPARQLGINLVTTDAVQPYRERKVYLLNGPHTTMAQVARLAGFHTVGQTMGDPTMRSFITREMEEEIIPVLTLPKEELEGFATQVRERFDNPFVEHSLDSIGLNSVSKYVTRLLPLVDANMDQGRGLPQRIVLALACLLYTYGGLSTQPVAITDSQTVIDSIRAAAHDENFAEEVLANQQLWGRDLSQIPWLADSVQADIDAIKQRGIQELIRQLA
ncbi:mannitol dehydrogenase [Bombiscardovia nodaiensis]|uniref:Mannitol dehydrogenase n=1 Tax=Bombiscardovia nodaiensis TaxID=2932181 RepID=A0ABM8B6E5_9BIFI|nr:mannitol dehydrogenase [Bombiscardovia nodaiensis]